MTDQKFPPYVNAYNSIPTLFTKIREAAVPTKFTNDFLSTVLGLKSSSHRALIPLLKRLGFLDDAGAPTPAYKDYRGERGKSPILAERVKKAYESIYRANEYAHKKDKKEIEGIISTATGASRADKAIPSIASTFLELVALADFDGSIVPPEDRKEQKEEPKRDIQSPNLSMPLGLSYTINLNLPPTTEIEVFNAIFKSLKENLLDK